jgi:hypothetical protein
MQETHIGSNEQQVCGRFWRQVRTIHSHDSATNRRSTLGGTARGGGSEPIPNRTARERFLGVLELLFRDGQWAFRVNMALNDCNYFVECLIFVLRVLCLLKELLAEHRRRMNTLT